MKRLPFDYKARFKRTALRRQSSRLRGRKPPRSRARHPSSTAQKPFEILAPKRIELLNLEPHHDVTCFLRTLRKESLKNKRVLINFKNTVKVHSCGTLLLVAEIDRLVRALGERCDISCTYPQDSKVEKVFQQIGLLKLLNKAHRLEITEEDRDVFHWRYATGIDVSPIQADPILKGIKEQIPKTFRKIVVGVEEAMDNSVHHAYIAARGDRLSGIAEADGRRWWLFAEVLDDWLHVNFCDLGIGIPKSLPRRWAEEAGDIARLSLSKGKKDIRMIARAFEVGRTRTELEHRGKGLKNIAAAARELGGLLTVHSNAGCLRLDNRPDRMSTVSRSYKRSILGTVVQWSIPLSSEL